LSRSVESEVHNDQFYVLTRSKFIHCEASHVVACCLPQYFCAKHTVQQI